MGLVQAVARVLGWRAGEKPPLEEPRADGAFVRGPALPPNIENFGLCLLFHLMLPLLPIVVEYWVSGALSDRTATITAALYTLAIGVSSTSMLMFGVTVIVSIFNAIAFGVVVSAPLDKRAPEFFVSPSAFALCSIALVFCAHLIERYIRHARYGQPFLYTSVSSK